MDESRIPLYTDDFAADPRTAYVRMRQQHGDLVPVDLAPGVPATLVIGYRLAVQILHDPDHFPADPRRWQRDIPSDCPVLPVLEWRPNALRNSGTEHHRYRQANVAAIEAIDLHALHDTVERIAIPLIDAFRPTGTADLIQQYARPLAFAAVNAMIGCPEAIGQQAAAGVAALFEGIDAEQGNKLLTEAMIELINGKRATPGNDVATRLIAHPHALDDAELIHQLVVLYGAGIEPLQNLIINSMLLILTDERFAGHVLDGSLSTRDALDEVLFNDPPVANFCVTYPRHPVLIENVWLPADQPVVISMAACNNDPTIHGGDHTGNRSHLAWSAGPHACPANSAAYLVAQDAIDQLLDSLPELELACAAKELAWRPGPFHRALATLPVTFPASRMSTVRTAS
ncbi:cytochrome P450 [Nocardia brasiliensis]|uniref:cytochrome P450 n=1 Tax=Nocardia brasiliensis TaxID=37326 RepID=UPI002458A045|nr:cytochrome P450 [Nocardia brasiliensis]